MKYNGKNYWDASVVLSPSAEKHHNVSAITKPYEGDPIEVTLFVSCYNEEEFIENTLRTVVDAMKAADKTYEIIVIDDCSKDSSVE